MLLLKGSFSSVDRSRLKRSEKEGSDCFSLEWAFGGLIGFKTFENLLTFSVFKNNIIAPSEGAMRSSERQGKRHGFLLG